MAINARQKKHLINRLNLAKIKCKPDYYSLQIIHRIILHKQN